MDKTAENILKECQACGMPGVMSTYRDPYSDKTMYMVICPYCNCSGDGHEDEQSAMLGWHRREVSVDVTDVTEQARERMRKAIKSDKAGTPVDEPEIPAMGKHAEIMAKTQVAEMKLRAQGFKKATETPSDEPEPLLPCPFCGEPAVVETIGADTHQARCSMWWSTGPADSNTGAASRRWNRMKPRAIKAIEPPEIDAEKEKEAERIAFKLGLVGKADKVPDDDRETFKALKLPVQELVLLVSQSQVAENDIRNAMIFCERRNTRFGEEESMDDVDIKSAIKAAKRFRKLYEESK